MKIAFLTNEYPPHIYGGAGVHAEYLSRELANLDEKHTVNIVCFGEQDERAGDLIIKGVAPKCDLPFADKRHKKLFDTLLKDVAMAGTLEGCDIAHCHTWYTHFAGCLVKQLFNVPLALTTHSLEPHRPWKVEQLGSAYNATTWLERTAYENADGVIAVSQAMKEDVRELYGVPAEKIRVIYNGIDLNQYRPTPNPAALAKYNIDPDRPFVLFVGRITRQKGIIHLVNAIKHLRPGIQVVLCAGAPDTEQIGKEMTEKVEQARAETENQIIWVSQIVPKDDIISLYTHALIFICPSVYEPFGIINLEAMACETPVVASAVGGIPEVVVPEETGLLVSFDPKSSTDFEPNDPAQFSKDLAAAVNRLLESPQMMQSMAAKSRERVEKYFSWTSIARQTSEFYRELIQKAKRR